MTTSPPKTPSTARRKRPASATVVSPEAEVTSPAQLEMESAVTGTPAETVSEPVVESMVAPTREPVEAKPDFESLPPLVGEFISKRDWTESGDHAIPPRSGVSQGKSVDDVINRIKHLNRNMGWILISAGLVGIVIPGVIGTPFVLLGGMILWPSNQKMLDKWRKDRPSKLFNGAIRQVDRFLDDMERRYPTQPRR